MTTRQEHIDNAREAAQQARLWRDDAAVSRELWRDSPPGSDAEAMHHSHMCDARQMMAACASLAVAEAVLAELAPDVDPNPGEGRA